MWLAYTFKRQTVTDLAGAWQLSQRQIRRELKIPTNIIVKPKHIPDPVVIVLDTTYFGSYGVMVFRASREKRNLLWYFVSQETNVDYLRGLEELKRSGYTIAAVVCDGKRWLCEQISGLYPVQHCQFHMMKIVTKYLTRHPEWQAGRELRSLSLTLSRTTEDIFRNNLKDWKARWVDFLSERSVDPLTGHWHYTHRRIRGAFMAIKHALPYLFTHQRFPALKIPNTTNSLDGSFSQLKQKIHVHCGLNIVTQKKMIGTILVGLKKKQKPTRNVH